MSFKYSAAGKFERDTDSTTKVKAVFVIDGIRHAYSATISPSVDSKFASNNATLYYSNLNDLNGTRSYSGTLGTDTFSIKFDNNVVIDGTLNLPDVTPTATVRGTGDWN